MNRKLVVGVVMVALLMGILAIYTNRPIVYHFDARTAIFPREFGWTAPGFSIGLTRSELILGRWKRVTHVALPGELKEYVEDETATVVCYAPEGPIQYCLVQSVPMPIDHAMEKGRKWAQTWNMPVNEKEFTLARDGKLNDLPLILAPFGRIRGPKGGGLEIQFEVRPDSIDPKRLCYINFRISWVRKPKP